MDRLEALNLFVKANFKLMLSENFHYELFKRAKLDFFLDGHKNVGVPKTEEIAERAINYLIKNSVINGKEKLIHFGATGYGHNYSAAARKSFKARHKCGTATSKMTARYWACKKLWAGSGGSTESSPKNKQGKY